MSERDFGFHAKFNKVILGLPLPAWTPVACHWQVSNDLRSLGITVDETHRFDTLQVELIRNELPYLCALHSSFLISEGVNNSKIAFIINLAKRFKHCQFRILNFNQDFNKSDGFPQNLILIDCTSSEDIKNLIISQMQVWQ